MAGIGSFDQTGRIGSSLKSAGGTYLGGQAVRGIAGAGPKWGFGGTPEGGIGSYFTSPFTGEAAFGPERGSFFRGEGSILGDLPPDEVPSSLDVATGTTEELVSPEKMINVTPTPRPEGVPEAWSSKYVPTQTNYLDTQVPMYEGPSFDDKSLGRGQIGSTPGLDRHPEMMDFKEGPSFDDKSLGRGQIGSTPELEGPSFDDRSLGRGQIGEEVSAAEEATIIRENNEVVDVKDKEKPKFSERWATTKKNWVEAEGAGEKLGVVMDFLTDPANSLIVSALKGSIAAIWTYIDNKANEDVASFTSFEDMPTNMYNLEYKNAKDGGIIGLANGGQPTMEMDYRGGGFIPVGARERADDVPARLSKNEFVMTADAVRAAGGGSVDVGAQRMYNLMNQLEGAA